MNNICTLCDYKYVLKALSLYMGLLDKKELFLLHWLCIDRKSYDTLNKLNLANVKLYLLENLENSDPELKAAKSNPPSKYGNSYSQYCWSLTPYFINYLLKNIITEGQYVTYIDADVFLYKPLSLILNTVDNKSIGIHTHRFSGPYNNKLDTGWFNVGIVVIKKDNIGLEASGKWKSWLLNPNNEYYQTHGTCGDQKYLELIYEQYMNDVCVFDTNILHAAPWACSDIGDKEITFYHFSHFRIDENGLWYDNYQNEWYPSKEPGIKKYYENYADLNKKAMLLIDYEQ